MFEKRMEDFEYIYSGIDVYEKVDNDYNIRLIRVEGRQTFNLVITYQEKTNIVITKPDYVTMNDDPLDELVRIEHLLFMLTNF